MNAFRIVSVQRRVFLIVTFIELFWVNGPTEILNETNSSFYVKSKE